MPETSPPSSSGSATGSKADGKVTFITPSAVLAGFSLVPAAGSDELLPLDAVELVGDSHLVQVRISGERKQTCLLRFPAEASNTKALFASTTGTEVSVPLCAEGWLATLF